MQAQEKDVKLFISQVNVIYKLVLIHEILADSIFAPCWHADL